MKFILELFSSFKKSERNELKLTHGKHDIKFKTKKTPKEVIITFGPECYPTCAPQHKDTCHAEIIHHGFILHADIKSNERVIFWRVK
jgi:hypothetical protein